MCAVDLIATLNNISPIVHNSNYRGGTELFSSKVYPGGGVLTGWCRGAVQFFLKTKTRWTATGHAELPRADEPEFQGLANLTDISFNRIAC